MNLPQSVLDAIAAAEREGRVVDQGKPPDLGDDAETISEKSFMWEVIGTAESHGWLVYHTYDSRRSAPGFPDLILLRGKKVVVAELKSAKGRLTKEQGKWLGAFLRAGVETYVWRPADMADIRSVLTAREET